MNLNQLKDKYNHDRRAQLQVVHSRVSGQLRYEIEQEAEDYDGEVNQELAVKLLTLFQLEAALLAEMQND
jgi:hypothetical protein